MFLKILLIHVQNIMDQILAIVLAVLNLGISWDVMLKMTRIELELILDIGMHLFIEKGMRGDISDIAKRCSKANNKYM